MARPHIPLAFTGLLLAASVPAQSFKERFETAHKADDPAATVRILEEWQAADSTDAELYVAWANYWFKAGRESIVEIGPEPGDGPMLEVLDPDTANKEPVAYVYGSHTLAPTEIGKALAWLDKGIARYPQRLDIRFGRTYMLGELEDYDRFTDEVVRALEHGHTTGYRWTWTGNEPLEDAENYMLSTVQEYQYQLYNTGDDALLVHMERIADAVLKHHPDHVESLSTRASLYVMNEQYDDGLKLLLHAEELAPEDEIVVSNIAEASRRKGDTRQAIAYYERLKEIGSDEAKAFAEEKLKELGK
jgi:tetratricopeptide (TPR) repeat protein